MSLTTRSLCTAALPGLLVALGCASTSSSGVAEAPSQSTQTAESGKVATRKASPDDLAPVYFDTDRSVLRPQARESLKQYAKEILDHPEWGQVTIDGHCDERGTDEYNLALGSRRAGAVLRYLVDLGVPQSRLTSRSFGEEKPAVAGHDESAWRYNRRSEFQLETLESARR